MLAPTQCSGVRVWCWKLPAPGLRFTQPNLPFLIAEIERELLNG